MPCTCYDEMASMNEGRLATREVSFVTCEDTV